MHKIMWLLFYQYSNRNNELEITFEACLDFTSIRRDRERRGRGWLVFLILALEREAKQNKEPGSLLFVQITTARDFTPHAEQVSRR